jgi:hypothetical protein
MTPALTAVCYLISFLKEIINDTGGMTMDLKLTNLEAVAVMNALQRYIKDLDKAGDEKGVQIERKAVKGLIEKIESMPAGEVP